MGGWNSYSVMMDSISEQMMNYIISYEQIDIALTFCVWAAYTRQ